MPKLEKIKYYKTAKLRKMAKKMGIPNYKKLDRDSLKETISGSSTSDKEKDKPAEKAPEKDEEEKEEEKTEAPEEDENAPEKEEKVEESFSSGVEGERVPVGSKKAIMKKKLLAQPKVKIIVPLEGKEKMGMTKSVILNGYRLNILKGRYVEVPKQVADILMESQGQRAVALDHERKIEGEAPKALR